MNVALYTGSMTLESWREALTRAFADAHLDATVLLWENQPLAAKYAVVWLPPRALFESEPGLRAVINLGAGVDALLAGGVVPPTIPIIRVIDAGMAPKIAEYVCFALARLTRGLERFGGPSPLKDWNADRPRGSAPMVGVMGLGAIGGKIAQAAALFDYPVIGWARTPHTIPAVRTFAARAQLDAFLGEVQILVNSLPLTKETENLLDAHALARLPRGAHLINVGRGQTIVDKDLLAALDSGQLAIATLDVFREEPLPAAHPFWSHPKVTVTPHLSGPTPLAPAAKQIAEALLQLERGVPATDVPGYV
ncbi:MAG: 2-hydroxyacid dehydrogenase, partial [Gemmatimonadales bacterium]